MNWFFRDTVFGQTVRFLSRNRSFKFPDEVDPNLYKQYIRKDKAESLSTFRRHSADWVSDSREKRTDKYNQNIEKTGGVRLVDWYGPDDKEVRNPSNDALQFALLISAEESAKLGNKPQAFDNLSDVCPQLWNLHRQLHLHTG